MRQRKVKNLEDRILEHDRWIIYSAHEYKGKWKSAFNNESDFFLELGAGKGQFLLKQAKAYPDRNYIGIEGRLSVVFRALLKLEEAGMLNVRFARAFVDDPGEWFSESEIAGIYLNFSDPWPKKRHANRRLTHRDYLKSYHDILKPEGFVEVKTDSEELFSFTENEVKEGAAELFRIAESSNDLHRSGFTAKNVTSEYEDKFIASGKKICYIKMIRI